MSIEIGRLRQGSLRLPRGLAGRRREPGGHVAHRGPARRGGEPLHQRQLRGPRGAAPHLGAAAGHLGAACGGGAGGHGRQLAHEGLRR